MKAKNSKQKISHPSEKKTGMIKASQQNLYSVIKKSRKPFRPSICNNMGQTQQEWKGRKWMEAENPLFIPSANSLTFMIFMENLFRERKEKPTRPNCPRYVRLRVDLYGKPNRSVTLGWVKVNWLLRSFEQKF